MKYARLLIVSVVSTILCSSAFPIAVWAQPQPNFGVVPPGRAEAPGAGAVVSGAPAPAAVPQAPTWIPLAEDHQKYLDQLLAYWEHKSSQTNRYRCVFKRWEYDPVFGPKEGAKTYSEGVIKYSAPDKGLFRVDKLLEYRAPRNPGEQPSWEAPQKATNSLNHWICDGTNIYEFDQVKQELVQYTLPPEVRGQAIGKGPLPFLFNAKSDDIKRRFWLRVITPRDTKGEYWLEAVPKTQEDAANFRQIHIIIDEADYLPKAMVLFDPASGRTTFQFSDREVNFSVFAQQLNLFHREFYEPKVPAGWTRRIEASVQAALPAQDPARAALPAGDGNARR